MKTLEQQLQEANQEVRNLEAKIKAEREKNKPKVLSETITTLPQVYEHLKVDPSDDVIKVAGFDEEDIKVVQSLITRMRICKVYNNGVVPKRGDYRHYPWHTLKSSGSGLVFNYSRCNVVTALTSSAARLAFLSEQSSRDYAKNFMEVEEGIIGL